MHDPSTREAAPALHQPALLIIDLQNGDAHPESDYVRRKGDQLGDDARRYYVTRLHDVIVPNTRRLIEAFRARARGVVYVRIQSLTLDGRDRSPDHKERGIHFAPGSWDGRILDEIAPGPNDVVVSKTSASAFVGTGLREILGNLGAGDLVVVGAVTGSCVLASVADARRLLGGSVVVVEDATAAWSEALQAEALQAMSAAGARVASTGDVLAGLESQLPVR